ncbi:MAG TPA: GrpB family protein, partial [Candidatus Paceibacterota bacterium]|nr:GrpB family protein [Candidatus Paceibacterota bacterium]
SVPMIGRPELDLMVISNDLENDSRQVEKIGFKQGSVELGKASYLKKIEDGVDVTVQILSSDNPLINRHRNILVILKSNHELRKQYEEFKKTLAGLEKQEYRAKKKEWLTEHIDPLLKELSS